MNIETTPSILKNLVNNTNATSAIITTIDGIRLFSEVNTTLNEDRIAATSSALLAISQNISLEIIHKELEQILLETNHGTIFIKSISENAFIILTVEKNVDNTIIKEKINAAIEMINSPVASLELV